ncbi:MAG: hypothetical protein GOVbin631_64 [Prokaryotic dsDNA virus sp.]|nr:MAG: hypothetical protein GOVbin631_64 [Prokaryotic dsDNA virus sp.]
MNYTIKCESAEDWGRGFYYLLKECQTLEQVDTLRMIHSVTWDSIQVDKSNITDFLEEKIEERRKEIRGEQDS